MNEENKLGQTFEDFEHFDITPQLVKKLAEARRKLADDVQINMSGKNTQVGFSYFELDDFLPHITRVCAQEGLLTVPHFSVEKGMAYLKVYDADSLGSVVFNQPISKVENKRGGSIQEIQTDGALTSYAVRYLYKIAFNICETDIIDASSGLDDEKRALIQELDACGTNFKKLFESYGTTLETISAEQLLDALKKKDRARAEAYLKNRQKGAEAPADQFEAAVEAQERKGGAQ